MLSQKFHNILGCIFLLLLIPLYKRAVFHGDMTVGCPVSSSLLHKGYRSCPLVEIGSDAILCMGLQHGRPQILRSKLCLAAQLTWVKIFASPSGPFRLQKVPPAFGELWDDFLGQVRGRWWAAKCGRPVDRPWTKLQAGWRSQGAQGPRWVIASTQPFPGAGGCMVPWLSLFGFLYACGTCTADLSVIQSYFATPSPQITGSSSRTPVIIQSNRTPSSGLLCPAARLCAESDTESSKPREVGRMRDFERLPYNLCFMENTRKCVIKNMLNNLWDVPMYLSSLYDS